MGYLRTGIFLGILSALFGWVGLMIGGESGMLIALLFACGMNIFAYWQSDRLILKMYSAELVKEDGHPLDKMMTELSNNAGIPKPKLYIIDSDQPNAFATGRNPENSAVAITTGLWHLLSDREMKGVIAHEIAHIKNYDTLIMTIVATISSAISLLANFGLFFGGSRDRAHPIVMILIAILAPLVASLIQMSISRAREYQADAVGAQLTSDPLGLAAALEKISQLASGTLNATAENNPATAHLFIINPLKESKSIDSLFSTHPNTINRIKALEKLHEDMKTL